MVDNQAKTDENLTPRHNVAKTRIRERLYNPTAKRTALATALAQFQELRAKIVGPGQRRAWDVANELLNDVNTPARTRWDICKTFLALAGHVAPKARDPEGVNDKPLVERSTADLRELCVRLEDEIAGRAIPVSTQLSASSIAQAIDMWG